MTLMTWMKSSKAKDRPRRAVPLSQSASSKSRVLSNRRGEKRGDRAQGSPKERATKPATHKRDGLQDLPDDVQIVILACLDARALATIGTCCKHLNSLGQECWPALYEQRYGSSHLTRRAVAVAGSWKALYFQKRALEELEAKKPCDAEITAYLDEMTAGRAALPAPVDGGAVGSYLFLVDGSGSMGDTDFREMKAFIMQASRAFRESEPDCMVGVVQFSSDTRVELVPGAASLQAIGSAIDGMHRMNGGTDIAAAIRKAGQLFKADATPVDSRVVILLTDGRIDSYQTSEAMYISEQLVDEVSHVRMYALGVGRGVTSSEMLKIIASSMPPPPPPPQGAAGAAATTDGYSAAARYLDLCVRADPPW